METDQVPESELPPVPEDDDLNATVIEVMTDVEVLLDGSSVIDVFAVNSARRKRVEVSERKLTEVIGSFSERQRSGSFNPGLITECLMWSRKSAREVGPDKKVDCKGKSMSVCVGLS